jgi:hypothetical protein
MMMVSVEVAAAKQRQFELLQDFLHGIRCHAFPAVYLHHFYIFLAQSYDCYLASLHAHWEALGVRLPRIIVKTSSLNGRHCRWNRSAKIGKSNTEELSPIFHPGICAKNSLS